MIVILRPGTSQERLEEFCQNMHERGLSTHPIQGDVSHVVGLVGDTSHISADDLQRNEIVERVVKVSEPYKLANRRFHPTDTVIKVGAQQVGGGTLTVMAGPCSVESEEQVLSIARDVQADGATFLRGGAFKPRSSPYSFQGMGLSGLELLKIAREKTGLPIVTEIMSTDYAEAFIEDVDVIQIGARNMQNFPLLREVGKMGKPVLLKRGAACTINELLMAAEYVLMGEKSSVILCERGIRTFEDSTRNTLDVSAVPVLKQKSHLPVIVDPSHGTGYWHLVEPMALAAVAAGADGLMIEVHNAPQKALCDGQQSITPMLFHRMMKKVRQIHEVIQTAQ